MNQITNALSGWMGVKQHCSLPVAAQDVALSKTYLLRHYPFSLIFNTLSGDLLIYRCFAFLMKYFWH